MGLNQTIIDSKLLQKELHVTLMNLNIAWLTLLCYYTTTLPQAKCIYWKRKSSVKTIICSFLRRGSLTKDNDKSF